MVTILESCHPSICVSWKALRKAWGPGLCWMVLHEKSRGKGGTRPPGKAGVPGAGLAANFPCYPFTVLVTTTSGTTCSHVS
jgi:hypothetical protein